MVTLNMGGCYPVTDIANLTVQTGMELPTAAKYGIYIE